MRVIDDKTEIEGPPSEIAGRVVLKPGQELTLRTPKPPRTDKVRIYRAGNPNGDEFRLLDDEENNVYTDRKVSTQNIPIPPFGNHPGDEFEFLMGSVIHPAQFGVALYRGVLYASDFYRFHAWPKEYSIPFPGGKALALTGNTVLVFTTTNVFAVVGDNPERLAKYLLSENHPLLNVKGLCRIADTIYWPTTDGLAASNGGPPKIVTGAHYTRKEWQALKPEQMRARTGDNCIFLEYEQGDLPNLRFDVDETVSAVTTYDTLTGGTLRWHSKRFFFDQPTLIDYVRVVADATVTLKVYADRRLVQTLTLSNDEPRPLTWFAGTASRHAREWSFEVSGDGVVRRIEAFERVVHTVTDEVRLTADQVPVWRSIWLKFLDADRWSVASISAQTALPVRLRFYADGSLVHTETVTGGKTVALPRSMPKATLWLVDVESPVRVDEVYLARRATVDGPDVIREVNDAPYAPWLRKRYKFTHERQPVSIIVHAAQAVRMRLYYDGALSPSETISITNDRPVRLARARRSSIEWDFDGADRAVREVIVFTSRVDDVGPDGVNVLNPPNVRGLLFKFADANAFACGSVGLSTYATVNGVRPTLKLYADGTLVHTQRLTDGRMFFLPRTLAEASLWEVDIEAAAEVNRVTLIPWRTETVTGRTIRLVNPSTVAPWLYTRFLMGDGPTRLVSAWVEADSPVTLRLYMDGAATPSKTIRLLPRKETRLDLAADCARLAVDVAGADGAVKELALFGRTVMAGDLNGITEGPRPNWLGLAWRFPDRADIACGSVGARNYDGVRLTLRADGTQHFAGNVSAGKLIKFPRQRRNAALWEADVEAANTGLIESLVLLPRRSVKASEGLQVTRSGPMPPWLVERYEFATRTRVKSVIVDADRYPVRMRFYFDGAEGISRTVTIANARETLVPDAPACGALEFDFDDDGAVRDVTVTPVAETPVGEGGIQLVTPTSVRGLAFKFPDRGSFACGSVGASAYPATLALTSDTGPAHVQSVPNGTVFQLPRTLPRASRWRVDVDAGTADVTQVLLLPWGRVPVAGSVIRLLRAEAGIPNWLYSLFQYPDEVFPTSAIVHADRYPIIMRLFTDGGTVPAAELVVPDAGEQRLPDVGTPREVSIDFAGDDHRVTNALVFNSRVEQLTGPLHVGGPNFRRRLVRFADSNSFACGYVSFSDDKSRRTGTYLRLYANGELVHTETVTGPGVFRLPRSLVAALRWEVDLESPDHVTTLVLVPWRMEGVAGPALVVHRPATEIAPWLYTVYEFAAPFRVASARIVARREVPLDLYADGATAVTKRYLLPARAETRLDRSVEATSLGLDFDGNDEHVDTLYLLGEDVVPVENGGVVIRPASGRLGWRNKRLEFRDTGSWAVVRVVATTYPVTVRLFAHGVARCELNLFDSNDVDVTDPRYRVDTPATDLPNAKSWDVDLECDGDIHELVFIARTVYPLENGLVIVRHADDPFTWIGRRVLADRPVNFAAARVTADRYPVRLRLFAEGRKVSEVFAHDGNAFRLPRLKSARQWTVDVVAPESAAVQELRLATNLDAVRGQHG